MKIDEPKFDRVARYEKLLACESSNDRLLGLLEKYEYQRDQYFQAGLQGISSEEWVSMSKTYNLADQFYGNNKLGSVEDHITALEKFCAKLDDILQKSTLPQSKSSLLPEKKQFLPKSIFTQKRMFICGVGIGAVVMIMGSSYGIYRYVKNSHAKGEDTIFDRLFAKVGLKKKRMLEIA